MSDFDLFVLCDIRCQKNIDKFLNEFAFNRLPLADDYPYPEFSQAAQFVFSSPNDLINQLIADTKATYSLYWQLLDNYFAEIAMIFFTNDESLIVGLGGIKLPIENLFLHVGRVIDGRFGYLSCGSPPRSNRVDFLNICKDSEWPSLYEGKIRKPVK